MTDLGQIRTKKLNELTPVTNLLSTAIVPVLPVGAGQAGSATVAQIRQPSILQMVSSNITAGTSSNSLTDTSIIQLSFTPTNANSNLIIEVFLNNITGTGTVTLSLGWNGTAQTTFGRIGALSTSIISTSHKLILSANHNGLGTATRNYQIFGRAAVNNVGIVVNTGGTGISSLIITEVLI